MFGIWPISSAPIAGSEVFNAVQPPVGEGVCARQIAVQGIGYGPRLTAVQGIGPCYEQPPVEPPVEEGAGGRGGFWYWSRLARWKPEERPARTMRIPVVENHHQIAPMEGRGRNKIVVPSVHSSAQIMAPLGKGILTGACYPIERRHRVPGVRGYVDYTRLEEEVLAMMLAEMEDEE